MLFSNRKPQTRAPQDQTQSMKPAEAYGGNSASDEWAFLPPELAHLRERYAAPADLWADMTLPANPEDYTLPESIAIDGFEQDIVSQANTVLCSCRSEMARIAHMVGLSTGQTLRLWLEIGPLLAQSMCADQTGQSGQSGQNGQNGQNSQSNRNRANTPHATRTQAMRGAGAQDGQARGTIGSPSSGNLDAVLTAMWPQDPSRNLDIARRGARSLGLETDLEQAGLSANPLVLKLAHAVGQTVREDALIGADPVTSGALSPKDAYTELLKIVGSDAYKRQDPHTVRRVEALAARASRRNSGAV